MGDHWRPTLQIASNWQLLAFDSHDHSHVPCFELDTFAMDMRPRFQILLVTNNRREGILLQKPKTHKVYFARSALGDDGIPMGPALREAFEEHGENLPAFDISGGRFQMRELERTGSVWRGAFVKLRDDTPHVVDSDDRERELELDDGDRIIEKCFFMYRERYNVLVWQTNRNAGSLSRAESYLSQVFDSYIALPQVMNEGELAKILDGNLYELIFAYDRPPTIQNGAPNWNQDAFDMMSRVDAAHAKFSLRAPRGGRLSNNSKTMVRQLMNTFGTEKIRVRMTDETEPIELFMAPLKDTITVQMSGRYPLRQSVFEELELAYGRQHGNIPRVPA